MAVSPDGQRLATAGADGSCDIASTKDGARVQSFAGHEDRVLGVAFSPRDGRWLLDLLARQDGSSVGHHDRPRSRRLAAARACMVGLVGGLLAPTKSRSSPPVRTAK